MARLVSSLLLVASSCTLVFAGSPWRFPNLPSATQPQELQNASRHFLIPGEVNEKENENEQAGRIGNSFLKRGVQEGVVSPLLYKHGYNNRGNAVAFTYVRARLSSDEGYLAFDEE
ncbi:uncharacterized protein LOC122244101, partial [Penaeus japonicus]